MKHTSGVDEKQVLDLIHVAGNIQFVTKSNPSIQKGELNPHEVDGFPFKPVFLELAE